MGLKDIVLKKGDIIYIKNPNLDISYITINKLQEGITVKACNEYLLPRNHIIVKVERPVKYETIYKAQKEILDKKEKEWLENFLRPFKDRILFVSKYSCVEGYEYICIHIKDDTNTTLPDFEKGKMYKGMKLDKEYTLEELGLFEE